MSAAGRSEVRRADDFYSTPPWVTRAILPKLRDVLGPDVPELIHGAKRAGMAVRSVLDPCAGDGAILEVVRDCFPGRVVHCGIELDGHRVNVCQARGTECINADALLAGVDWGRPALVITNPPFSLALEFVETAMIYRETVGSVLAFLLRLNWLEGAKRAAFHREHPADIFVLPHRPSFTGDGKTDATAYAWFVWGLSPRGGHWEILDCPDRKGADRG